MAPASLTDLLPWHQPPWLICYHGTSLPDSSVTKAPAFLTDLCYQGTSLPDSSVTKAPASLTHLLPWRQPPWLICYQGTSLPDWSLLPRHQPPWLICYQGTSLPDWSVTKAPASLTDLCYQGTSLPDSSVTKAPASLTGVCYHGTSLPNWSVTMAPTSVTDPCYHGTNFPNWSVVTQAPASLTLPWLPWHQSPLPMVTMEPDPEELPKEWSIWRVWEFLVRFPRQSSVLGGPLRGWGCYHQSAAAASRGKLGAGHC